MARYDPDFSSKLGWYYQIGKESENRVFGWVGVLIALKAHAEGAGWRIGASGVVPRVQRVRKPCCLEPGP